MNSASVFTDSTFEWPSRPIVFPATRPHVSSPAAGRRGRDWKRGGPPQNSTARESPAIVRPGRHVEGADEIFEGEATQAETLRGACDGIDLVFSALGITRQRDTGVTYRDVDLNANLSLLEEARRAQVVRFGVIAVVDPGRFRGNPMVDAKEQFVTRLRASFVAGSSISGRVVRATGFFSDMRELLEMARRGSVFLFGDGQTRINPIAGADVAGAAVDALLGDAAEGSVGGPDVLTWDEIAELALGALAKERRIRHDPRATGSLAVHATRPFAAKSAATADFVLRVCGRDLIAPKVGTERLSEFYRAEVLAHRGAT